MQPKNSTPVQPVPSIEALVADQNCEILISKATGLNSLGRMTDLISGMLVTEVPDTRLLNAWVSELFQTLQSVMLEAPLSSNILHVEFCYDSTQNVFWVGIRGSLERLDNPIELKRSLDRIYIAPSSEQRTIWVQVKRQLCFWALSFPMEKKPVTMGSRPNTWNLGLTNQEARLSAERYRNVGDIKTDHWLEERAVFRNDKPDTTKPFRLIKADGSELIDPTETQQQTNGAFAATLTETESVKTNSSTIDPTEPALGAQVAAGSANIEASAANTTGIDVEITSETKTAAKQTKNTADVSIDDFDSENTTENTTEHGDQLATDESASSSSARASHEQPTSEVFTEQQLKETNVEKLQQTLARVVRILDLEKQKIGPLVDRALKAERTASAAKPMAKELEGKLDRAVRQISNFKREADQLKIKVRQIEGEKNKVENELRTAKAQISTLQKRQAS